MPPKRKLSTWIAISSLLEPLVIRKLCLIKAVALDDKAGKPSLTRVHTWLSGANIRLHALAMV